MGPDASRTIRNLGDVLAEAMLENIPHLAAVPIPDFTNGLAPLSGYVDKALADKELRLLFILDEFDELPPELFERTDSSSSLFQPLRQISNKRGCGFLLVGGENMQRIVNLQGDRLNKFRRIGVGSFERSDEFAELIRKPVENWLTISDSALFALFEWSAGNPYFAKLLATELFTLVVEHRYSDASEIEVTEAIDRTLNNIGANSFAHFWTDGLIDSADRLDEQHMIRRAVLIAVGRALRRTGPSDADSIWSESGPAIGFPMGESRFRMTLQGFVGRGILAEDDEGYISPQIPLFQAWLKDDGVGELLEDSRQLDDLRAKLEDEERIRVKDAEVFELCQAWQQFRYRGQSIVAGNVIKWLEQFETHEERRLMFRLLKKMRLYDETTVRAKMQEAFGIVARNIRTVIETGSRTRRDVLVTSLDDSAAKSGMTYCRLFASENQIWSESVIPIHLLENRLESNNDYQRVVIIDDFSGTGRTLTDGLENHMGVLRRANKMGIRIVVVVVAGFGLTRDRLQKYMDGNALDGDVYFCDELGSEDRVFLDVSKFYPSEGETRRAKQVAESKGVALEPRHPLGFSGTQAAIVFYQSCPNNTLPILWSVKNDWFPLFARQ